VDAYPVGHWFEPGINNKKYYTVADLNLFIDRDAYNLLKDLSLRL
jgi:hypothetical protein